MSIKALRWAFQTKVKGGAKFVLVALADAANTRNKCWPSIECLMEKCGMSKRAILNNIEKLIIAKLITKEYRYTAGKRRSNVYTLNTNKGLLGAECAPSLSAENSHLGAECAPSLSAESAPIYYSNEPKLLEPPITQKEKQEKEKGMFKKYTEQILYHLNGMTNKHFPPSPSTLKLIEDRMRDVMKYYQGTEEEAMIACLRVIDHQHQEWSTDKEKKKWLRPGTIFREEKFNNYIGQTDLRGI